MFSTTAQALMEAAIDAIVVIDHRGIIIGVNEAAHRMFGYRRDELLGERVGILMAAPDRAAHDGYLQAYLASGTAHVIGTGREVVAKRQSGACFTAHLSIGRIPESAPPRYVGFVRDSTVQTRGADAARLTQERLTSVSRLATLGEMAAGIAHELNQPLTAINAYARASERFISMPTPDLAELRDAVREIGAEALRAGDIIRRMRQLVRTDPGEQIEVEAGVLIEELRVLITADARIHGAHVHYRFGGDGARIKADGVQIQQLILNLVRNAFEALATQAPQSREIEIATGFVDGQVEISITDNGPGVPPGIADRLFDAFCTTKPGAIGLGLAISRTIARSHGGSIGFRQALPHGACFYVRLPPVQEAPS